MLWPQDAQVMNVEEMQMLETATNLRNDKHQ
jgi:hypothetical protein